MSEWRPIEEAPWHEAVLVFGGDCKYAVSASRHMEGNEEVWVIDAAQITHAEISRPTHFMPLPPPPKVAP